MSQEDYDSVADTLKVREPMTGGKRMVTTFLTRSRKSGPKRPAAAIPPVAAANARMSFRKGLPLPLGKAIGAMA